MWATISVSSCLIPNPGTSPAVLLNYAWRSCCQLGSSACSIIRWVEILHCCPARSIQALGNAAGCQASKRSSTCQVAFSPFSSINCWSYLLSGCGQFNGTRRSGLPPVDPVPNSNLSSGFYDFLLHMNLKINLTHMSTQQNWSCIWRHQQRKTADFIRRRRGEKEGVNKKLFVFPFRQTVYLWRTVLDKQMWENMHLSLFTFHTLWWRCNKCTPASPLLWKCNASW